MSDDGRIWIGGLAGLAVAAALVRRGSPLRRVAPEPEIGWEFAGGVWFLDHLGVTWRVEPTTHAPTRFRDPPSPGSPVRWAALRLDGVIGVVTGCLRRRVCRVRYHEGCRDHEFKTADDARGAVETYLGLEDLPLSASSQKRRGSSLRRIAPEVQGPERDPLERFKRIPWRPSRLGTVETEVKGRVVRGANVRAGADDILEAWHDTDRDRVLFFREPRWSANLEIEVVDLSSNLLLYRNPSRNHPDRPQSFSHDPSSMTRLMAEIDASLGLKGSALRRVAPRAERPEEIRGEIMSVEPVREDATQFRVVVEWDEGDFGTWMASSHDFGREPRSGDRVRTCPDDQFVYPENRRKKGNPKRGSPLRETPGSGPTRGSWLAARGSSAARGSTLRRVAPASEPEPEPSRFAWIGLDEGPDADLTLEHETGWWDIVRSVHRPRPSGPARFGGWTIHSPVPHVGFVRVNGFGKGKSKVFKTREEAVRVAEEVLTEIETRSGNRKHGSPLHETPGPGSSAHGSRLAARGSSAARGSPRGSPLRRVAPQALPPWIELVSFAKEALVFHGTGPGFEKGSALLSGGISELESEFGVGNLASTHTVGSLYDWMFELQTDTYVSDSWSSSRWRWVPFCLLVWSFLLTKVTDPEALVARPGWSGLEARRAISDRALRFATQIRTTGRLEGKPGIANDLSLIRVGLERHPSASKDDRVARWVIPGLLALRDALRKKDA